MFSKSYFLVFVLTFFVAGFFLFALPDTSIGQDPGCCRTFGTQCFDEPGGPCMGNVTFCMTSKARCDTNPNNQYIEDQWCVVVPGVDLCEPQGCCLVNAECEQAPQTGCESPQGLNGTYLGDGLCGQFSECVEPPTGCCDMIPSGNSCQILTADECSTAQGDPNFGLTCTASDGVCDGDPPPPVDGCCQFDGSCNDLNNQDCGDQGGTPVEGGECDFGAGFCDFDPPTGCCAIVSPISCNEGITETVCEGTSGFVTGDWQQGTQTCNSLFQCTPEPIITNVPTIGQWGMIAMAGLLGIFSLFIIMRRHRYNVS